MTQENQNKPTIIAVVGASASGKTLFAQTIHDELMDELGPENITIIKEDSYYRCQNHLPMEERVKTNYDHPQAFEHDLLLAHLNSLLLCESIDTPVYCYNTHTRTSNTVKVASTKIILVEGILLLSEPSLREIFDIKVYMDTPLDICLIRRIKRDMVERERSLTSITDQYVETVRPMYHQFVEPSKAFADIVVTRGGKNRMAIEVLKAQLRQLT